MDSERSARSARRCHTSMQWLPAPVEAVLEFGHPKDLVLQVYQQLSTGSPLDVTQPGNDETEGASGGIPEAKVVTAADLLTSVEEIVGSSSASGNDISQLHGQESYMICERKESEGPADGDLERDGSHDVPELPSPSTSLAHHAGAAANRGKTSRTTEASPSTSSISTSTAGVMTSISSTETSTSISAGAITSVGPGSTTNDASPSRSSTTAAVTSGVSSQPLTSLVPPTPVAFPEQPPAPQLSTATSSKSAPPNVSVTEKETTPADERAKERKRLLTKLRALRAENQRLKARQTCRHCRQNPVDLTFLPCGHFVFCQTCGSSFDTCPVCRKTILADIKTFLS